VFIWNGYVDRIDMCRLNIGGKFLTNYLKEVVSYRQYNMMDETYLINKVKESTCYVSQDFSASLETIKHKPKGPSGSGSVSGSVSGLREGEVRYVLPDYSHSKEGYVLKEGQTIKEDQQVLVLGNERFAIPELLFTPSDVGRSPLALVSPLSRFLGVQTGSTFWDELVVVDFVGSRQGGLAEAVVQAVNAVPEELRSLLFANIILVGGNTNIPGFQERLYSLPLLPPSPFLPAGLDTLHPDVTGLTI